LTALDFLPRRASKTEIFFVVEEAPEGGFVAKAVGASIHTEADTLESLRTAFREAVACHFEEGTSLG